MFRRINFFSICFAFGLSILLILAGSRYTDNVNYRPIPEGRRILRNYQDEDDFLHTVPMDPEEFLNNDKILYDTLLKNKFELNEYNFTYSGAHSLKNMLIDSGGKPLRSLIVSTWRSGTTFLGEILNAMPGNFYHYEPLLKYEIIQIRGPPLADEVINTISNFLKCDFKGAEDYFDYGKTHLYQFSHNTRLWDHCKYKRELCYDAEFTGKFCKLFPFQSMKVVRIRLHLVQQLLKDKDLNVKVLLLVRDPRAVLQSRQHRDFCQPSPDCWRPELLCADMISDYVAATRLIKEYPDRLMVLRYEELALDPYASVNQIFKFLSLAMMPQVEEFLRSHTSVEAGGVSSTFRVSREVPFKWRHALDFNFVEEIQTACKEAMDLWGYALAHNFTHMTSKEFYPLLPYTI